MNRYLIFFLVLILLIGCNKKESVLNIPEEKIVARVNDDILTTDDIKDAFGPYLTYLTDKQKEEYVNDWIKTTLMYQEALKEGVDKDPTMKKKLKMMKKVMFSSYMQEKIAQEVNTVSDQEIEEYFKKHEKNYNTLVTISYIIVNTQEEADSIEKLLREGKRFVSIAKNMAENNPDGTHTIGPFRWGEELWLPSNVMNTVFSIDITGKVVGPIPTDIGYVFVQLKKRDKNRKKIKLEDVQEEIREQLTGQKIEKKLSEWIINLKNTNLVEEHVDRIGR